MFLCLPEKRGGWRGGMVGVICVVGRRSDTFGGVEENQRKCGSSFTSLFTLCMDSPVTSQVRGECCAHLPSGCGRSTELPVALYRPPQETVLEACDWLLLSSLCQPCIPGSFLGHSDHQGDFGFLVLALVTINSLSRFYSERSMQTWQSVKK